MTRGITKNDVWDAADALLLEGARPTIERVRQKIGRGSPNTVSPYLDTWFKHLGSRIQDPGSFSAPPDVPDPVMATARHLWEVAQGGARADLAQQLQEGLAGALRDVAEARTLQEAAESARLAAVHGAKRLQSEVTRLSTALQAEAIKVALLAAELDAARTLIHELQRRLAESEAAHKAAVLKHEADLDKQTQRSAALERRALLELDGERTARAKVERRADSLEDRLQHTAQAAQSAEAKALKAQLEGDQARRDLATTTASLDAVRANLVSEAAALADARAEVDRSRGELQALRALVARLTATATQPDQASRSPARKTRTKGVAAG